MNKEQFGELQWWFGQQRVRPVDDNILPLQQGLIQKLAEWSILFIGVKPQRDGSLEFLLEKSGIQFTIKWWGGGVIELHTLGER
jgi:hypothetical protein